MSDFVLERMSGDGTHFRHIEFGDMHLSIQASQFHYCSPRLTLASSDQYQSFEVALILKGDWFHPEKDERFANTTWAEYWSKYDDVASHVPRGEVAKMISDLGKVFSS